MIVRNVIPSGGRIAIGCINLGMNEKDIQRGSLNILYVSKSISVAALQVLYGYRTMSLPVRQTTTLP